MRKSGGVAGNHDPIIEQPKTGRFTAKAGVNDLLIKMADELPNPGSGKGWMRWKYLVYEVTGGKLRPSNEEALKWIDGEPAEKVDWKKGGTLSGSFETKPVKNKTLIVIFMADGSRGSTVVTDAVPVVILIPPPKPVAKRSARASEKESQHGQRYVK